jgi:hypothetical protein
MSAEIVLSPAAAEQLLALPAPVQQSVGAALEELAQDPFRVIRESKRILGSGTLYKFIENEYDGHDHTFFVPFRLFRDGDEVQILAIAKDLGYR